MPAIVQCPRCRKALQVSESSAGQTLACPHCRGAFVAPGNAATQAAAAERSLETLATPASEPASQATSRRKARTGPETCIGTIGRFRLVAGLGQGAFGRVYRAYDPLLDREVALKVPKFPPDQPQQVERFVREAKAAAQLRHPNIVAVFESGKAAEDYYIASEFVEGSPLSVRIAAGAVDFRQSAAWVRDLALGLAYAHDEGIVHRDIKPANIMLGKGERPQVMDFGLAKRVDEDATMTTDGSLLGTPAYMSPEQARGDVRHVGPASDQYSLGVVLYELLTGKKPFEGPPHLVIKQVTEAEPRNPSALRSSVPRDLEAICLKAMEKSASRRYATTGELAADLDRWLRGEPILARPIGSLERMARWCRRQPALAASLGVAAAALLLAAVLGSSFAVQEARSASRLRQEQAKTLAALNDANAQRTLADQQREFAEEQQTIAEAKTRQTAAALQEAKEQRDKAERQRELAVEQTQLAEERRLKEVAALEEAARQAMIADDKTKMAAMEKRKAHLNAAGLALSRGLERCEKQDIDRGLLFLARSLELVPPEARELEHVIRTNLATWGANQQAKFSLSAVDSGPAKVNVTGQPPLAFSSDGKLLATGTTESYATIWNAATGTPIGSLPLGTKSLRALAFSPDDQVLVTGGSDTRATLWNTHTLARVMQPIAHEFGLSTVAFCSAKPYLATGGNGVYVVREVAAGGKLKLLGEVHQEEKPFGAGCAAFTPDGERLLWAERNRLCLGDYRGRRTTGSKPMEHHGEILDLAISPDGKKALTGSRDKTARLWDLETGEFQAFQHHDDVNGVAFSTSGTFILTGCQDRSARLWDLATGMPLARPWRHSNAVHGVAINPDGKSVVTATIPASVQIWEMPQPLEGAVERIVLWMQYKTGMELEADETIRVLDESARNQRAVQLDKLGGPPIR